MAKRKEASECSDGTVMDIRTYVARHGEVYAPRIREMLTDLYRGLIKREDEWKSEVAAVISRRQR